MMLSFDVFSGLMNIPVTKDNPQAVFVVSVVVPHSLPLFCCCCTLLQSNFSAYHWSWSLAALKCEWHAKVLQIQKIGTRAATAIATLPLKPLPFHSPILSPSLSLSLRLRFSAGFVCRLSSSVSSCCLNVLLDLLVDVTFPLLAYSILQGILPSWRTLTSATS